MKITSVFASINFKLLLEFDNREYRILDIKQFLKSDMGLLAEVRDNLEIFRSAELDMIAQTVSFQNGVDLDGDGRTSTVYLYQRVIMKRVGEKRRKQLGKKLNIKVQSRQLLQLLLIILLWKKMFQ
ncbi:hypothetical protein JQN58_01580 [Aneurinibacillus sp. BA2021]|nr:hypothetical protein [Aneurinibacillus sp. BA2021]